LIRPTVGRNTPMSQDNGAIAYSANRFTNGRQKSKI